MMTEQRLRGMEQQIVAPHPYLPDEWHANVRALIAEVRRLQQDVAFHADCRPNRRQAEAAIADAKATNDRWADAIRERDAALAERDALRDAPAPTCRACGVPVLDDAEVVCADCLDTSQAALTEARRVLREVLPVDCEHVHHPKRDQHPFDAACPVLQRAAAVLAQEEK